MDILTDMDLLKKSVGPSVATTPTPVNTPTKSEGYFERNNYNPINMGMEWGESFKLGWNHIKVKMQEDDELKQLSTFPISDLSKTDQERVYNYALKEKEYSSKILSPLGEDIRNSVVE